MTLSRTCLPLLALAVTHALHAEPASQPATAHYQIAAKSLDRALVEYSLASGVQVVADGGLTGGINSPGVTGRYTPAQALQKLLAGTGISARTAANGTVTLEKSAAPARPPQAAPAPAKSSAPQSGATVLPTVTVTGKTDPRLDPYNEDYVLPDATTGTKTDTPIMETPLNIQVVSKQVLKDQQVIRLDQALKNVSGVTTASGSLFTTFGDGSLGIVLRGFASDTYLRNGFRLMEGAGQREMANLESVEVLKGSAAILYGLVEPGGMVNVVTKQPLATPYYSAQQQFGSYSLYRTTVDATGPLTKDDTLLYRLNLSYENSGSFRDFVYNEKVFVAPVLKWNISPKDQLTLELEYNHNDFAPDFQTVPLYQGKLIDIPRNLNYQGPGGFGTYENIFGSFNWSHQFNDDWSIKHRFSVAQVSNDQTNLFPISPLFSATGDKLTQFLIQNSYQQDTYSTNLDLTGHFDTWGAKHTLLFGGDYYRIDTSAPQSSGAFALLTYIDILKPSFCAQKFCGQVLDPTTTYLSDNHLDLYGLYLQDQIKLPYGFHFTGGLRYQYLHRAGTSQSYGSEPTDAPSLTADKVTPRFGLLWRPQDWLSLYSNYTENFGTNPSFQRVYPDKPLPPTSAQQWEVGAKSEFFDGRLRVTLAYYDLTKQNVSTSDPNHPFYAIVTGEVRSRGPELDIQGEILPGWNVIANYANTDIIVTKGNDTYPTQGSRFYGVPRNTGSLWNTYEFKQGDLRGLKFGGGVTLRDASLAYGTNTSVPGYAVVDLLAAYSLKVGRTKVTAQLNVNNLLDKYYLSNAYISGLPSAAGYDSGYVNFGAPRSFLGSLRVDF